MSGLVSRLRKRLLASQVSRIILGDLSVYGIKKYLRNTSWMISARIGTMLISFLTTLYIARELGPTNYGELSYAISFVALFSFIASLGIDNVLYRELIKYPHRRGELLGSAFTIRAISALIAVIITVTAAFILSPEDVSRTLIIVLSFGFIFQTFNVIGYEFQARVRVKSISILSLLVSLILNCLKILTIFSDQGVIYLALILLLEAVLFAFGYVYLYQRTFGEFGLWKANVDTIKKIILDTWPFFFIVCFTIVQTRIDQIILKNLIHATSVGIYDVAIRLTELWYFVPATIVGSLFPAIINAQSTSTNEYYKRIKKLFILLLLYSGSVAICVTLFAEGIVLTIFGSEFYESINVLRIYIWGLIPMSLIVFFNYILLAENSRRLLFFSALLAMVANISLNLLLIPSLYEVGAAFASVISSLLTSLILGVVILRKRVFVQS